MLHLLFELALIVLFTILTLIIYRYFIIKKVNNKLIEQSKELSNIQKELRLSTFTDYMTKLYNRRYFSEISIHILDLAKRDKTNLSVIMIDIDYFKKVNDTYGHKFGDTVLINLSNILQNLTRKSDIVCRWGGEEFMIILPKTDEEGTFNIAEKIRLEVENLILKYEDNSDVRFTISIGMSQVDIQNDMDIEASINRADEALYKAKESGRNKVCIKKIG